MDPTTERRIADANLINSSDQLDDIFGDDLSRRLLEEVQARKEGRMNDRSEHRVVPNEASEVLEQQPGSDQSRGRGGRRGLVPALAGAAIVIAAFGIFLFRSEGRDLASLTPSEVVQGYVEARNAHDGTAMESFLADEVAIFGDLVKSKEDLSLLADYERAVGWQFDLSECDETRGQVVVVVCPYSWISEASEALGNGYMAGSSFTIEVTEEGITELTNDFMYGGYVPVEAAVLEWLEETHPEELATMVDTEAPLGTPPRMTEESIVLWDRYTEEFVSSITEGG